MKARQHSKDTRLAATLFGTILALAAGCDRMQPPSGDAPGTARTASGAGDRTTEIEQIELKSPPAVVSSDRHTGPFAGGSSLSLDAVLKPLDPVPVKEVRLDTTHKIIEIAPGVRFSAWTFGDQVPGPTVRARVGDRIRFTMTNRSDEPMPAGQFVAAPMMHSMDFHSAMVSPQDKYRS
ncbi:MAG: multicopper oxidase domain-containing protein, partial [Tepidisphaeraceae bacterium]